MRILLLGCRGQVGWELQRSLAPLGELIALDRKQCDLANIDQLRCVVRASLPQVVVNAAAYTAVDKAESEPELAHAINANAPAVLAEEVRRLNARLIHYSTDYVFDGSGDQPWCEDDPAAPQSAYGRSKLAGEDGIRATGADALIFRTSWVFGVHGGNFLKTMLKASAEREELRIVADQTGAPTPARLIADVTAHALRASVAGSLSSGVRLYHLAPAGTTNWHTYASLAIDYARGLGWPVKAGSIVPIATVDWPTPATRPANSRLDCRRLEAELSLRLPTWESGVLGVIDQLLLEGLHP